MTDRLLPRGPARRAVLGSLAVAAVGGPFVIARTLASAAAQPAAPQLLWSPNPATDGLKAFEGIEADRAGLHPGRKYVYVENDYYRFDIYKDDRDTTGGGDRQRTESKGMVVGGTHLDMHDGDVWTITYELYIPSTLHGTSHFTHIFQLKTVNPDAGPWITLSPSRSGSTEILRAQADSTSGNPAIASTNLAPLRDKWITIEWTFTIGPKGTARFVCLNGTGSGAPVVVDGTKSGLNIPANGDRVRPKWGIYRSIESASSDILDTHLFIRNYKAYKGAGTPVPPPTTGKPTATPTTAKPTGTAKPTSTATAKPTGSTTWVAGHAYKVGDTVTYNGKTYRCLQAHTSMAGWEPPNAPALWQAV